MNFPSYIIILDPEFDRFRLLKPSVFHLALWPCLLCFALLCLALPFLALPGFALLCHQPKNQVFFGSSLACPAATLNTCPQQARSFKKAPATLCFLSFPKNIALDLEDYISDICDGSKNRFLEKPPCQPLLVSQMLLLFLVAPVSQDLEVPSPGGTMTLLQYFRTPEKN